MYKTQIIAPVSLVVASILISCAIIQATENDLRLFGQQFETRVIDKIKNDKSLQRLSAGIKVTPLAVCYLDPEVPLGDNPDDIIKALKIDSLASYSILEDLDNEIVGTVNDFKTLSYSIGRLPKSTLWESKMVDTVIKQHSKNPFLISFSDLDTTRIVAFFNNGELNFIDRKMQLRTDVDEVIKEQNGTMSKFLENMKFRGIQITAKKTIETPEKARIFLRKDYIKYSDAFPNDTAQVMYLLLEEIRQVSKINERQAKLIRRQVEIGLEKNYLTPFYGIGVWFFGLDISRQLKSVLTRQQYYAFIEQRELNSWLSVQASDVVYKHLFTSKNVPQERIPSELNKYIFGR